MEMHSQIVGKLTSEFTGSWKSVPVEIPYFDNQELVIVFAEFFIKEVLDSADKALAKFLELTKTDRLRNTKQVYKYYYNTLEFEHASHLHRISEKDIWSHVTPTEIFIDLDDNEEMYIIVFCECSWEEEHGLQLVFKDGRKLTRASGIDGLYVPVELCTTIPGEKCTT